jgi:tagatose 1,6-diphosphate aldolase GatY/KbaY
MLVPFADLLSRAASHDRAVGAFTAYNLETAVAVLEAAARRGVEVMLLISEQSFASRAGPALARALVATAADSSVPCSVQLDHVDSMQAIEAAFEAGLGAVMADGSKLPYGENAAFVAQAVALAARFGGGVEAELGRIEGDEEIALAAADGKLTDPAQAASFITRTGASCLAVSIGNAHGRYLRPPQLDLDRLEQIRSVTAVPLSLHGASGLPDVQVTASIQLGIRKVNVNTELRDRYFDVLADRLPGTRPGARLLALQEELIVALADLVECKLALLGGQSAPTKGVTS